MCVCINMEQCYLYEQQQKHPTKIGCLQIEVNRRLYRWKVYCAKLVGL